MQPPRHRTLVNNALKDAALHLELEDCLEKCLTPPENCAWMSAPEAYLASGGLGHKPVGISTHEAMGEVFKLDLRQDIDTMIGVIPFTMLPNFVKYWEPCFGGKQGVPSKIPKR